MDSVLVDAAPLAIGQGNEMATVTALERIYRCGPLILGEELLPSNVTYKISACIAMDAFKAKMHQVSIDS